MAAVAPDATIDASLAAVATSTVVHACSSSPANFAGIAAVSLGSYTLTAGTGNGDWLIANGDVSGRKLTLLAQSGNNGTANGVANFLAFATGSTLMFVADADGETINSGSPWTIGAFDVWEIADPS